MHAPENENPRDHKEPILTPESQSNRMQEGYVTTWFSPLQFRKNQVLYNEDENYSQAWRGDGGINDALSLPKLDSKSQKNLPSTPQIARRTIA